MEGKRVDSKLMLFTLVLVLITLLLLNYFLENNRTDGIWNYKELTTADSIIYLGEETKDRTTYYILESIVKDYLNSYVNTYSESINENKIMYEDYYNYLSKNYKKFLNKTEYIEISKNFWEKFYVKTQSEYEVSDHMDSNGVYLCKLESSYTGKTGYIAIALQKTTNSYTIVYIE